MGKFLREQWLWLLLPLVLVLLALLLISLLGQNGGDEVDAIYRIH